MKRDGAATSLWQATTAGIHSSSNVTHPEVYDLIIAGGGITGILTAYLMQKAGKRVLLLEAQELCFGTTSGTTAHLNTFLDTTYHQIEKNFNEETARLTAKAVAGAISLYHQLVEEEHIDCELADNDALLYARDARQLEELNQIFASAKKYGVSCDMESGNVPVNDTQLGAIRFPGQASVHPARYALALARRFQEMGGVILQHCKVEEVVEIDNGVAVDAELGAFKTKYFLWATHIPPGINLLHFECAPYRSYAMAFEAVEGSITDFIYDLEEPYHYYRPQTIEGRQFIIVGGEDHKTGHEANPAACFLRLEAHARNIMNLGTKMYAWSSQYYEPADGLPYIGVMPGSKGHVLVATGYGGNGMIHSHVAAAMLTDLLVIGQSPYVRLYDPSRSKSLASLGNIAKENADVIKEFVSGRFSASKIKELSEMAAGEGKIVKYEGEKLALYKDEQGGIHALHPVCTHAKCIVSWNDVERSWDCPCHGARFDPDGAVLNGPAVSELKRVDLD